VVFRTNCETGEALLSIIEVFSRWSMHEHTCFIVRSYALTAVMLKARNAISLGVSLPAFSRITVLSTAASSSLRLFDVSLLQRLRTRSGTHPSFLLNVYLGTLPSVKQPGPEVLLLISIWGQG